MARYEILYDKSVFEGEFGWIFGQIQSGFQNMT